MTQVRVLNTWMTSIEVAAPSTRRAAGNNSGFWDFAILQLSGEVVDQETFTLGGDVYEINVIATDSMQDTGVDRDLNNTHQIVCINYKGGAVGDVLRVGPEFMIIIAAHLNSAVVSRGFAGSRIKAHGNRQPIFTAVQEIAASSNFAVPVSATDPNTADALIARAVQWWSDLGYQPLPGIGEHHAGRVVKSGLLVDACLGSSPNEIIFAFVADGVPTSVDGVLSNGTMLSFPESVERQYSKVLYTLTDADVSAGKMLFVSPFPMSEVFAEAFFSEGPPNRWDKTTASVPGEGGQIVELGNLGADDWVEGDHLAVHFYA